MNLYDYETDILDFVFSKEFSFWTSLNCCPENIGEKKNHLQHSLFVVKYLLLPTLEQVFFPSSRTIFLTWSTWSF